MEGIFRIIKLLFDPKGLKKLEEDGKKALDEATDPKVPEQNLKKIETGMQKLAQTAKRLLPVLSFGAIARQIINNTRNSEAAFAQLENTVRVTGGAAGFTTEQLVKMSQAMADASNTSVVAVQGGLQRLLAYSNIQGEAFERAAQAALDMSSALGIDMVSAAETLGAALDDPVKGLGRLARQNFRFTDSEKAVIDSLVEANDLFGAQTLILQTIEDYYEGAAIAARDTLGGALNALNQAFQSQLELGRDSSSALADGINLVARNMERLAKIARDLIVIMGAFGVAKALNAARLGMIALNTAAAATNVSLLTLIRTTRLYQMALGPVGWITAALSAFAMYFLRVRDAAQEAKQAQDALLQRRAEAMRSTDIELVRQALVEAQESLARLRAIAAELKRPSQKFRDDLDEEKRVVEQLSRAYTELITRKDEATAEPAAAATGEGAAARDRTISPVDIGGLIGLGTPQEIQKRREQIRQEFTIVEGFAQTSMEWRERLEEKADERRQQRLLAMQQQAQDTALVMTDAFAGFFDGMIRGFEATGKVMDALEQGVKGFGLALAAAMSEGQAEVQMAKGLAALGEGTLLRNPAALKAAALHFAAAGAFRAIASVARRGGISRAQASVANPMGSTRPSAMAERMLPEINIYIDPLNPTNPAWQSTLAQTLRGVRQRYGSATVNVRPRTA